MPSISGSDAECDVQHELAKDLDALGLDVDLWAMDLAGLEAADGFPGTEAERSEAWGLVGTWAGEDAVPGLVPGGPGEAFALVGALGLAAFVAVVARRGART